MSWMVESIGDLGRWALAATLLALGLFLAGYADAQERRTCGPRAEILKHLAEEFREQPVAIGLSDNGALVEVLADTEGTTWTLLFSLPNGVSCLIAAGQDWRQMPAVAAKLEAPI